MGALASNQNPFVYKRREPEKTLLYSALASGIESWLAERKDDTSKTPLPDFVEKEFRGFLRCGILQYGFIVLECPGCKTNVPVAYSCKLRGFCPSCGAKRQAETVSHLVDNVLPKAPFRQWVTTFPYQLRFWMATNRSLTNAVHKIVSKEIMAFYERQAEDRGIKNALHGGSTFIQRFGSACNLNVHFHSIVIDGIFSVASGVPKFYQLRGPEDEEVGDIVIVIADKIIAYLRQLNYLPAENDESGETTAPFDQEFADSEQLTVAAFASNSMKIAFGINAGKNVRRIGKTFGFTGEHALIKSTRCASANGFTLHANRYIGENERHKLEELLSYAARPAFSHKRLSLKDPQDPDSDFVYELKAQWTDGTRAIQLSREELFEKLAALIPPPYIHLSRHFGVFSSSSKWRSKIVTRPQVKKGFTLSKDKSSVERMSWSKLLARVFKIDVLRCPVCLTRLNPDQWERVDTQPHIALMLVALNIDPRPPPIVAAGDAGSRLITYDSECRYVDFDD